MSLVEFKRHMLQHCVLISAQCESLFCHCSKPDSETSCFMGVVTLKNVYRLI